MGIKNMKIKPKYYVNYAIVGTLLVLFTALDMVGIVNTSTSRLLTQMAYSIILAVSLNLVVGFLGELSLGHAGFMCVGSYIGCFVGILLRKAFGGLPVLELFLSVIVGGLFAALFGFLIGLPTLRLKGDYLAIATLAFGEIVRNIFKNLPKQWFGGAMGLDTATVKFGKKDPALFIFALLFALLTIMVAQNFMRSKHGRAVQAIRDNEIAARAMGVNITYYKLVVFIIGAFFAGVAGVIYGHSVTPVANTFFSFNYSIEILVMVVLGGMGNLTGSILSAIALTFLNVKLDTTLSGDLAAFKYLIYAVILIAVVIWNNAPALKNVRERVNFRKLLDKLLPKKPAPEGGKEAPTTAAWDKIPTKIPMDAILSTDFTPDHNFEPDQPQDKQ